MTTQTQEQHLPSQDESSEMQNQPQEQQPPYPQPKAIPGLTNIPLELRQEIYSLVLVHDTPIGPYSVPSSYPPIDILFTNRKISAEAAEWFYGHNKFNFYCPHPTPDGDQADSAETPRQNVASVGSWTLLYWFLGEIGRWNRRALRYIYITVPWVVFVPILGEHGFPTGEVSVCFSDRTQQALAMLREPPNLTLRLRLEGFLLWTLVGNEHQVTGVMGVMSTCARGRVVFVIPRRELPDQLLSEKDVVELFKCRGWAFEIED